MTDLEITKLCDLADELDPVAYSSLCEQDVSDKEFVAGLQDIIAYAKAKE